MQMPLNYDLFGHLGDMLIPSQTFINDNAEEDCIFNLFYVLIINAKF